MTQMAQCQTVASSSVDTRIPIFWHHTQQSFHFIHESVIFWASVTRPHLEARQPRQEGKQRQVLLSGAYIQEEGDTQFQVNKVAECNQMILFLKSLKYVTFPSFVSGG